jgi:hypothetical protein
MPQRQEVTRFIEATFGSVWALELLILLRQQPKRAWTHAELVAALRASELIVCRSGSALAAAGLVEEGTAGTLRYRPRSPECEDLVAATETLYSGSADLVRRLIATANPDS